uniref:DNA-directed DNA polymerase n=1 Tax=viral metagenome TaxID=1070528 RepID=A0A6C0IA14_9ZZZZ
MKYTREKATSVSTDLVFQTLDWYCDDFENDSGLEYKIFAFGVDSSGNAVSLRINSFKPFFFIELPSYWDSTCVYSMKAALNITDIEFLERKRYYGFENNKVRKFLKLSFESSKKMRSMRYLLEKSNDLTKRILVSGKHHIFPLYESNIDPILRFTHIRDILTAGWVKIDKGKYIFNETEEYFECNWKCVNNYQDNINKMSNIRILYFDIEACSQDGSFPNALKKNDRVTQICCVLSESTQVMKYLFNLGTCDSIDDTTVIQCKSEKQLLNNYAQFIRETDPDIIVGYNIFGFDNGYLFDRAKVLEIESTFNYQSKLAEHYTSIEKKILNNQQSGFNDWKMTRLVGRTHIDLLQVIKKDFKLESYKLNNVGEHFLGEGKDDVSPKQIFEAWNPELGDRVKRTVVGKYCVQDTMLCLKLFEKFAVLPNHLEMAKVTRVPVEYLITRGQSIKVFSQIAYETRKAGFLIPVLPRSEPDGKFQGATVLEAKTGYYTRPVAGLDFASLYPSIMIAHNMCYSTVVLDARYQNVPGFEYSTINCGESLNFSFVQNQPGVLSGILESLWKNRKVTKKEMNACTDPFMKTVLNAKQLAIKVSMNSIYGFTGAVVGALPCLEISQSVTGCGRQMIEQTSNYARDHFACEIVYGDSVAADTPVLIKYDNVITTVSISSLFDTSRSTKYHDTKMQFQPENIQVWTSNGWRPIMRVIRHLSNKQMYRVHTPTGLVDVSEDHSLLDLCKNEIKPNKLKRGASLYHSYPKIDNCYFKIAQLESIFDNIGNVPRDRMSLFYRGYIGLQKIPTWILNEKPENQVWYLYGLIYSKIDRRTNTIEITTENKLYASRIYLLIHQVGLQCIITTFQSAMILTIHEFKNEPQNKQVISVTPLSGYELFIYDLETSDSTFQAGVGSMIVHNTDSCYVIFPEPVDSNGTLTTLFKKAEHAAAEISKTFKKPIELEFEKFMYPLILVAKKRYMYIEWTDPAKHNGHIEAKGVELVRRDNCPYVKETLDKVLRPIMFENNLELGRTEAEHSIDDLLSGKVPIKKLIISKNLRSDYKNPGSIAHYQLVEKMKLRDPESAPKPGDRVPFVYVNINDPKALSWKKVEDPQYVIENNVPIDNLYYLEHQLMSPLKTIFDILLGEMKCNEMFTSRKSFIDAKKQEKLSIADSKRIKERNNDIRDYFNVKLI